EISARERKFRDRDVGIQRDDGAGRLAARRAVKLIALVDLREYSADEPSDVGLRVAGPESPRIQAGLGPEPVTSTSARSAPGRARLGPLEHRAAVGGWRRAGPAAVAAAGERVGRTRLPRRAQLCSRVWRLTRTLQTNVSRADLVSRIRSIAVTVSDCARRSRTSRR